MEQLSAINECQNEIELFCRLEGEFERDNKWAVDLCQDSPFGERMGNFGPRDDVRFADRFESVYTESVPLADLHDLRGVSAWSLNTRFIPIWTCLSETAFANDFQQFKTVDGQWSLVKSKSRLVLSSDLGRPT